MDTIPDVKEFAEFLHYYYQLSNARRLAVVTWLLAAIAEQAAKDARATVAFCEAAGVDVPAALVTEALRGGTS